MKQNTLMDIANFLFMNFMGFCISTIIPLFINLSYYVNVFGNMGVIVIRFFGIPLLRFKLKLSKQVITIIKGKGKEKQINLDLFDPHILFTRYYIKSLFSLTIIYLGRFYADVGVKNDAFKASMISGGLCALIEGGLSVLHTRKTYVKTFVDIVPNSSENELRLCGELRIISIPILMLYGFIRAKILTKRWFKLYERYREI